MDSSYIFLLLGVIVVVGIPWLEKLLDKSSAQRRQPQSAVRQPRRQPASVGRQASAPRPPQRPQVPAHLHPLPEEGARVTEDRSEPTPVHGHAHPEVPAAPDLRTIFVWSEILKRKF